MNNIKRILLAYMNIGGLTQEDMGNLLGISRQSFNYKLNGRVAFTDKEKIKIAELFNTDVGSIFFSPNVSNVEIKVSVQ
ncbi:MAG: transcriptional regulator [Bacteroidota bacterium]|nr:transcriptional regulator [Bacteroidota bacterium]